MSKLNQKNGNQLKELAEKLNGNFWKKGNLQRVYLDRGHNTKKMSTKTFIWQDENGNFKVSCRIDCPSQGWAWINSQQESVKESVMKEIEDATATEYHFAKKKGTELYFDSGNLVEYKEVIDGELYPNKERLLHEMDNCGEPTEHFEFITISREEVETEIERLEEKANTQTLSTDNVNSLIGKKIKWSAPGYRANGNYEGISIIKSVDLEKDKPLTTETISGDNLAFAFLDKTMQGKILCEAFCFSDTDRYVTFSLYEKDTNR